MNTPTHILFGMGLFARRGQPRVTLAALLGGLVPDTTMLAMVLWFTRIKGIPEHEVFGRFYFSEPWQRVFAVDHSFVVWSLLLGAALAFRRPAIAAFAGAGLAHAAVDFFTHGDDARRQFWPLSDWAFQSPVSYWDPARYSAIVAPVEFGLVATLTILLVRRLTSWWERGLTLAVASVIVVPVLLTGGFHGLHGMG